MEIENNILYRVKDADVINGKFTIPKEVTEIGDKVFKNNSNLIELDTENVEVINNWAFYNCKNLKKVTAYFLEEIWNRAFDNCKNLEEFYSPNLEFTYCNAFNNCISLPCPNNGIRKEIYELALDYLNKKEQRGLCDSVAIAISDIIVKYKQAICLQTCFPLFTYQNAKEKFGATGYGYGLWWLRDNREIRKAFLKYCYENKK